MNQKVNFHIRKGAVAHMNKLVDAMAENIIKGSGTQSDPLRAKWGDMPAFTIETLREQSLFLEEQRRKSAPMTYICSTYILGPEVFIFPSLSATCGPSFIVLAQNSGIKFRLVHILSEQTGEYEMYFDFDKDTKSDVLLPPFSNEIMATYNMCVDHLLEKESTMSYCRFSTNDFQCDVYLYEDVMGGFTTHLAAIRVEYQEPLPEPMSLDADNVEAWLARHRKVMEMHKTAKKVRIDLPMAGETFNDETALDLLDRLLELRSIGYRFPLSVIEAVREEAYPESKDTRWYVHVCVCGVYAGAYDFATLEEAEADCQYRKKFHVLGARYELTASSDKPDHM